MKPELTIHKSARDFAIANQLNLGRLESGFYFLRNPVTLKFDAVSNYTTAKSALAMMRRALRAKAK